MTPGPDVRALIGPYTGEVGDVRPTKYGFGSDLTAVVECERGPYFVKAMRKKGADPRAIDAFAAAGVRMQQHFAEREPAADWLGAMAGAARRWAAYRGVVGA